MNIVNEVELSLNLDTILIMAGVMLKVSEAAFMSSPLRDLSNVNCWLSTILAAPANADSRLRGIALMNHSISIDNATFDLNCVSCTSPKFAELIQSLYSTNDVDKIQQTTNQVLDGNFMQVLLDQIVAYSASKCPHSGAYDPNITAAEFLKTPAKSLGFDAQVSRDSKSVYFTVANSIIAAFLFILGVSGKWLLRRRNKKWVESLSGEGKVLLSMQQQKEQEKREVLNQSTTSLFSSPHLPKKVRIAVPVCLVANAVLYMVGHFGVLSTVDIDATLAGQAFTIHDFLVFSFIASTKKTYLNGGSEMAILIWIFTGIWPYVKIILSLLLWFLPPEKLTVSRRGRLLLWIDALAKLSVIDIFTLILGVAILLVYTGGHEKRLSSAGTLYSMKFIVIPRVGCYLLLIAQRMSRVSSRYFLDCHQRVVDMASRELDDQRRLESPPSAIEGHMNDFNADVGADNACCSPLRNPANTHDTNDEDEAASLKENVSDGRDDQEMSSSKPERECFMDEELDSIDKLPAGPEDRTEQTQDQNGRWGRMGIIFAGIFIGTLFIIGCIFAPAISLDTSDIWELALESGRTFEQAVSEYGVFAMIGAVLVKARFVLDTKADYVGFGLLLFVGIISVGMTFLIQAYQFLRRRFEEWRQRNPDSLSFTAQDLPSYMSFHKWKHMEIYLISVSIGVWQLGSITMYAIHQYCDILYDIYAVVAYIGLIPSTDAQCFRIQAKFPGNLVIIILAFCLLLVTFIAQASAQYRQNVKEAAASIDEDDMPRMSMIWHPEKSKSQRYAELLSSSSFSQDLLSRRTAPMTPPTSGRTSDSWESDRTPPTDLDGLMTPSTSFDTNEQTTPSTQGFGDVRRLISFEDEPTHEEDQMLLYHHQRSLPEGPTIADECEEEYDDERGHPEAPSACFDGHGEFEADPRFNSEQRMVMTNSPKVQTELCWEIPNEADRGLGCDVFASPITPEGSVVGRSITFGDGASTNSYIWSDLAMEDLPSDEESMARYYVPRPIQRTISFGDTPIEGTGGRSPMDVYPSDRGDIVESSLIPTLDCVDREAPSSSSSSSSLEGSVASKSNRFSAYQFGRDLVEGIRERISVFEGRKQA